MQQLLKDSACLAMSIVMIVRGLGSVITLWELLWLSGG
jgi:hypothetical protein